jgi:hypothetical protein
MAAGRTQSRDRTARGSLFACDHGSPADQGARQSIACAHEGDNVEAERAVRQRHGGFFLGTVRLVVEWQRRENVTSLDGLACEGRCGRRAGGRHRRVLRGLRGPHRAGGVRLAFTGGDLLTAAPWDTDLILAGAIVSGERCGDHARGAAEEPFEVAGQHICRASA